MISIKSDYEIALMKKAGNIVYKTHQYLKPFVKPGITTKELDKLAYDLNLAKRLLASKGITFDEDTIRAAIEAQVKELKENNKPNEGSEQNDGNSEG